MIRVSLHDEHSGARHTLSWNSGQPFTQASYPDACMAKSASNIVQEVEELRLDLVE
jgi:hypothetical protein